jgi:hypothetical protein
VELKNASKIDVIVAVVLKISFYWDDFYEKHSGNFFVK